MSTADEPEDLVLCPVCGHYLEWERCWAGCDDGFIDEYEEDPINNDPGDLRPRPECNGLGGYLQCTNLPHKEDDCAR